MLVEIENRMILQHQLCLAVLAGFISHIAFFIHGEHHLQAPNIFRTYIAMTVSLFLLERISVSTNFREAAIAVTLVLASYSTALFTSVTIYRTIFHKLNSFQGPFLAKVTKFWNVAKAMHSTNYRLMDDLHRQYGDFVRTGKRQS